MPQAENTVDQAGYPSAWEAAEGQGMDMSLIELNLEKPPWERLLEHDDAIQFAEELRGARRVPDAEA